MPSTHPGFGPSISDAALLCLGQAGDGAAFAAVYDRHAAAALRLASRLVPNSAAAEDVVQEAFLTLWRTRHYDPAQGGVRGYLMAIVHNRAIDHLRKDRRRSADTPIDATSFERVAGDDRTDADVERNAAADLMRGALTRLPDDQRATIELAYFAGLTHLEIATLRHEPIGTVKSRVRLGLEKLRGHAGLVAWR